MKQTIYEKKISETISSLPVFQQERIYRMVQLWVNMVTKQDQKASLETLMALAGTWEDERSAEEIIKDIRKTRRSTDRGKDAF